MDRASRNLNFLLANTAQFFFLVTTILLGDRQQTESPSALLETVKAKHSGNQGLPSEVEDLLKGRR